MRQVHGNSLDVTQDKHTHTHTQIIFFHIQISNPNLFFQFFQSKIKLSVQVFPSGAETAFKNERCLNTFISLS